MNISGASPLSVVVQVSGKATRMDIDAFNLLMNSSAQFRGLLTRYMQEFVMQLTCTAACNSVHTVLERLTRVLLVRRDQVRADTFSLTHENLAALLAVRRAGITTGLKRLQELGYIQCRRSSLCITDVAGLRSTACECYAILNGSFSRVP